MLITKNGINALCRRRCHETLKSRKRLTCYDLEKKSWLSTVVKSHKNVQNLMKIFQYQNL